MSAIEDELESRLNALPDLYDDFTWITMYSLKRCGLVEATLNMLKDMPDATTNDVTTFECEYSGAIELYDEEGQRKPAEIERLVLTREMREILADLKGKTFKSFECVVPDDGGEGLSSGVVGITLGQHAVYLFSRDFPFIVGGSRVELSALRCERKSLRDDFGLHPDVPVHAYAVGERVTGVELVTDHVEVDVGGEAVELEIDIAVVLRTAYAVYTFARESLTSTRLCIAEGDEISVPYAIEECADSLAGLLGKGVTVGEAARMVEKLA